LGGLCLFDDERVPTMPPEEEKPESKSKRKGCLWKLGIAALVVLPVLAFLVNGPVFRKLAAFGIEKGAETQGLTGSVTVRGTILSGVQIEALKFSGDGSGVVRSVAVGDAGVDYSIAELIKDGGLGWLEEVKIEDVSLDVVLPEQAKDDVEEEEPGAEKEPGETDLAKLIGDLLEARYELKNIDVRVTQGDKVYLIEDFKLVLPPGGKGELSIGRLEIPQAEPREGITTDIEVRPESLALGPLRVLDPVELTLLEVNWASDEAPLLAAKLDLSGGEVEARYGKDGAIDATLTEGAISLPPLLALAGIEDLSSGRVETLDLRFSGDFGAPATWKADIGLDLGDLTWEPATVDAVSLKAAIVPGDGVDETGPGGTVRRLRDEDAKNATRLVLIFRLPRVERSSNPPSLALASAPPSPPPC
jgi:hypothetical protein